MKKSRYTLFGCILTSVLCIAMIYLGIVTIAGTEVTLTSLRSAVMGESTDTTYGINGDTKIDVRDIIKFQTLAVGEKFTVEFENTDDYLYRVGNKNTVTLDNLFAAVAGCEINSEEVEVKITNIAGNANGTYTANTSAWQNSTIQFTNTGVVEVVISEISAETKLLLEVVDATNVTEYSELGNKNSVLLNDITMSSGSSYYLSGATLYGNGFTLDMTDGTYAAGGNTSSNYVFGLENASLDNVKIVGAVYTTY